ncbi:MAG TPA: glycosyltransferase [Longimicrobiales bacterium]
MRVLYISKALTVAAYRDKLWDLAAHAEVTALVPARWGRQRVEPDDGAFSRILREPVVFGGHNHFHLYVGARRILDAVRPELVHIDEEPYSAVTFQWTWLCRRRGVPTLFFAWQNLSEWLPPPFGAMRGYVFRSVAGAIAGTSEAADVLRAAGYGGALAVIPQFGVDPARFAPDPQARRQTRERVGAAADDFVVGYGGRLVPEKGLPVLIEAVRHVPRARLLVVGDGPERRRLERDVRRAGIGDRVRFVGHAPSLDMPRWLAGLDVLVLPSIRRKGRREQFGRILVEAMACGVPVVGSSDGEIPRVIGDAGRVVPERDAHALAAALRELMERPQLRTELGCRARERVLERFTHERIALETAEFYRTVSAVRPHGSTSRGTR